MTIVTDIGTCLTAAGVGAAVVQLQFNYRRARTDFEDRLTSVYRQLVAELPVDAMLGKKLTPIEDRESLSAFYRYFDLCNEQIFLRESHRVSKKTWNEWKPGVKTNLGRPAFRQAWRTLAVQISTDFEEFRKEFKDQLVETRGIIGAVTTI
jgi:hypothetical protein